MISRWFPTNLFERTASQSRLFWLRPLAVIAVLLLSISLPFFVSLSKLQLVFVLIGGAAGALVLIRWPQLGLLMICMGGMVLPTVGPNGLNVPMVAVGMLSGLWLLDSIVNKGEIRLAKSRTVTPLLVFIVISSLAFIVGQLPWFNFARNAPLDAQLGGLSLFILAALAFLLAANQLKELVWLERITFAFLAIGALYIFSRTIPGLAQVTRYVFQAQAIGGVFWACLPAVAIGQALFNRDLKIGWRVLLVILVVAAVYVAYVQNYRWKSGWIPALTGVGVVVLLKNPKTALLMALAGLPVIWRFVPDLLASDAYSISTRFDAWIILGEIIKVSPIIGMGFGNYYWYTPLFSIRGFDVTFNSHNNYVDIVAQTGAVGLLCLGWFFAEVGKLGWQLRKRVPAGFPQAYVNGVLGALVATLVAAMLGDWVLPFVYNVGLAGFRTGVLIWFFLGGLVLIENLYPIDQEQAA